MKACELLNSDCFKNTYNITGLTIVALCALVITRCLATGPDPVFASPNPQLCA